MEREAIIRLGAFICVLVTMMLWELVAPRRRLTIGRATRWPGNLGISIINTAIIRLVLPVAAVGVAVLAEQRGWGLFRAFGLPEWLAFVVGVIALDLAVYLQHVMAHAVPLFWRLHRMHHADLDFDCTTGVRFHPIEVLLSMGIKMGVVSVLGLPVLAVVVFEVLLNATSVFNHGNVRMWPTLDRVLRWLVVTPDMHRVHHSIRPAETNSNFGFNLTWWDRLFGTYRCAPADGHVGMTIGIDQFRDPPELRIDRMLAQPFRGDVTGYPINRTD
jgi:sterol desaturase/sphingolipid hydroxylase (fatty acid hydroxylase superfamily)